MEKKKFIDIDKLLREKATKVYRWLPRFAINWLKRKLHEEEINHAMNVLKDERGLEFNKKGPGNVGC